MELVGVPMMGVRHGCGKAREDGGISMVGAVGGRNTMAERRVLRLAQKEDLESERLQEVIVSQLY